MRFSIFYFVCGIAAALIHVASEPGSLVLMTFFGVFVPAPAILVLSLWIAVQICSRRSPSQELLSASHPLVRHKGAMTSWHRLSHRP